MINYRVATILAATLVTFAASAVTALAAPVPSPTGVTGKGTVESPYTAGCDTSGTPGERICTVTFPSRTVKFWDGEKLESYQCPSSRPYLANVDVPPHSNKISKGIEIRGMAPFGIQVIAFAGLYNKSGVPTGIGEGSVSNWNTSPRDFGVTLHCTNVLLLAYPAR